MAFDHRGSFEKGLFGTKEPVSAEVKAGIVDAKELIFEAHLEVVKEGRVAASAAGVLVDEEFGSSAARKARAEGAPLPMPVERSGQDEFQFEYGEDYAEHIEAFDPTFAKVLVRYNPEGDGAPGAPHNRAARPLRRRGRLQSLVFDVPGTAA